MGSGYERAGEYWPSANFTREHLKDNGARGHSTCCMGLTHLARMQPSPYAGAILATPASLRLPLSVKGGKGVRGTRRAAASSACSHCARAAVPHMVVAGCARRIAKGRGSEPLG
jgi:hypothetical protein